MHQICRPLLIAASLACVAAPASARDGWNAAGAVLGAAGGFALGAAIANSAPRPVYVAPPPRAVYVPPPRPVFVESIEDEPVCFVKRRRYVDEFGDVVIRRVKVCE